MKATSWHRLLLPAVERHPDLRWRSTHVVAHVLCDLAKAGGGKVAYGGVAAIVRRSGAYNGGSRLNPRTVERCLGQLRTAGLLHLDEPGGRGRLASGRPRGGRGNANGYGLALALGTFAQGYPQPLKTGPQTGLSDPSRQGIKTGPQTPPESGSIDPSSPKKGTRGRESSMLYPQRPDESVGTTSPLPATAGPWHHEPTPDTLSPTGAEPEILARGDGGPESVRHILGKVARVWRRPKNAT